MDTKYLSGEVINFRVAEPELIIKFFSIMPVVFVINDSVSPSSLCLILMKLYLGAES